MNAIRGGRTIRKDRENDSSAATDLAAAPLDELLVHTSLPAAAVAVKLCGDDSAEETGETANRKSRDILNTFKRRAFSRISFKGESGPLLSR